MKASVSSTPSPEVRIIGGGFSGLTLAWYLSQKGHQVVVYEKADRFGGMISSARFSKMLVESAANGLMWTESVANLFHELDLKPLFPRESARKRYIWRNQKTRWPLTFKETLLLASKFLPGFLFRKSQLAPKPSETLQQWGERTVGSAAVSYLLEPAFQGIYGGKANELSASLLLSRIWNRKKSKYRGLVTAPDGMGQLISTLVRRLKDRGVRFEQGLPSSPTDLPTGPSSNGIKWVLATSAPHAAQLLANSRPTWAQLLSRVEMISLMSVAVSLPRPQKKIDGFGMLVPRSFGLQTMGVIANSTVFENRGVCESETWIFGGASDPKVSELSDSDVKKLIENERQSLLGDSSSIEVVQIHRWNPALPKYSVELERMLPLLQSQLAHDSQIFLTGNYLGGIGLSQILEWNLQLATRISEI